MGNCLAACPLHTPATMKKQGGFSARAFHELPWGACGRSALQSGWGRLPQAGIAQAALQLR